MSAPIRQLDEDLHPVQLQILRNMSETERIELCDEMTRTTLEMSFLNLSESYPNASDQELKYRFASLLYGAELAAAAFGTF